MNLIRHTHLQLLRRNFLIRNLTTSSLSQELVNRKLINQQTYYQPTTSINSKTIEKGKEKLPFITKLNTSNDISKATEKKFSIYLGIDPTSTSLHLGHLLPILTLFRFNQYGHPIILLLGGATGSIGDPSGRNKERNLLSSEVVQNNHNHLLEQLHRLINNFKLFNNDTEKGKDVVVLNNKSWLEDFKFIEFLNVVGRHFRINTMLNKDSVKSRLESNSGISFTEFSYQLLQAYDYYHLYKNYNCQLQLGGNDQWGNILAGLDLINKLEGHQVSGLTTNLMLDKDGNKLSKSTDGVVYLDTQKTSVLEFYQYLLKVDDNIVKDMLLKLTFYDINDIDRWCLENQGKEDQRFLQKKLADHVTKLVHGEEGWFQAKTLTSLLFNNTNNLQMSYQQLDKYFQIDNQLTYQFSLNQYLDKNMSVLSLIQDCGLVGSKGEGKRLIQNNGLYLNQTKVTSIDQKLLMEDLVDGWGIFLRLGKSKFKIIKFV